MTGVLLVNHLSKIKWYVHYPMYHYCLGVIERFMFLPINVPTRTSHDGIITRFLAGKIQRTGDFV
jgi:hypothetical protein